MQEHKNYLDLKGNAYGFVGYSQTYQENSHLILLFELWAFFLWIT